MAARRTLGAIRAVTFAMPDIEASTEPYMSLLGYRLLGVSNLTKEAAGRWQAPALAGAAVRTLGPASGEPVVLRFVEQPAPPPPALTTHGWNATEMVVANVDHLAERLATRSAFRIIGPPAGLSRFPMIRAMQVLGPSGECLYFTEIGPGSGLDLAPALSEVGRVFIVVAGGPGLDALFATYAGFSNAIDPPVATPVRVISAANGLPPDTLHPHGLVRLEEGTLIELDGYPTITAPRAVPPGGLPPGMAMVSFAVRGGGDRLLIGAAGERIELLEERR